MNMSKPYEELEFTDNFMFVKVMSTHLDLCQELLELILNKKIRSLKVTGYEDTVLPAYESRGIRMDVVTEDEKGVVYDIEMQARPEPDIAKRSRYYHSVMDIEQLTKGTDYSRLKKSFVIFICKEKIGDEFTGPIYTFSYKSDEEPVICLNDETWTVFVNSQCESDDLSAEIREFLGFIRTGKAKSGEDTLARRLADIVNEAKTHRKWSVEYMRWEDELRHREFLLKEEIEAQKARADAEASRADAEASRAETAETELAKALEEIARLKAERE